MKPSHLAVAAAVALAALEVGATLPAPDLPDAAITTCEATLQELVVAEGHSASHRFNLTKHCPALVTALTASLNDAEAPIVDVEATSVEGLHDLRAFAAGFERRSTTAENHRLDLERVDALLAEVLVEEDTEESTWDRFLRWLEQHVKDGESPRFGRFLDWLEGLEAPPWLGDLLINTSLVLIVLLALIVIGNELWLTGLLRRGWRKREERTAKPEDEIAAKPRIPTLDELPGLPPRQLAAGILAIVTATLAERGWLSSSSSLTNGELVRQIGQRRSALVDSFSGLVNGVETILYGDLPADDETRHRLIATARALVEDARRASTAAPVSSR